MKVKKDKRFWKILFDCFGSRPYILQSLYLYSPLPIEETIELYTMIFLKYAAFVPISIFHSTHNFYIPQILINK